MSLIRGDKCVPCRFTTFIAILTWLMMLNFFNMCQEHYVSGNYHSHISNTPKDKLKHQWSFTAQPHKICLLRNVSQFGKGKNTTTALRTAIEGILQVGRKHNYSRTFQTFQDGSQHVKNTQTLSKSIALDKICCYKSRRKFSCDRPVILLLVVFIAGYIIFSNKKSCRIPHDVKDFKGNSYGFVFGLCNRQKLTQNVYHFSLKKYINEIDRKGVKNNKHMVHEWARLESFQTFPKQCPVSTLRLAQTGFYYTGKGVEVICFCCGLKNEHWTENETVSELHKRLSPHCKFIRGEDTDNVPIHGVNEVKRNDTEGACGGPNDGPKNRRNPHQEHNERSGKQTNDRICCNKETEQFAHKITSVNNQHHSVLENGNVHRTCDNDITEEIQYFPGIPNEQPKRPEYAIRSERLFSFSAWSFSNIVKPEALAEAGFFFTEMQDLVRCFFCGGGMKNWAYGDSPWIEHARWFPACAYLKQCKGEDFVNLCQMSSMTFPTQNNFHLRDLDSHRTTIVEDQEIVDLNSIAAKRVFKMGYSQTQIEDAIRHTRLVVGQSVVLKAQTLLEYLLVNCHINSDVTSPHTSTAEDEQNNARSTEEDVPSSSESNTSNNTNGNTAIEAEDIEERQSLKEENRLLKEQMMCKVCMDKDANTVFLPCGHLVACDDCAKVLRKCAVCRKIIQGTVRAYPA